MTHLNLTAILKQIESLPTLPSTVNRVMAVTANPDSSALDLMEAILPDQSMCTAILKIANSAFFGMPRQVASIEKAVVVLGFDEIRNVVLGKAVFNSLKKLSSVDQKDIDLFWEHSFTCGLAAKILAEHLDYPPSEMFIAGLLHDIGKLAILMTFPDEYPPLLELSEPYQFRNLNYEQEHFAATHDEIGMRIMKRWLFPEQLQMAAGYHHRPEQAPAFFSYPILVQTADILAQLHSQPDRLEGVDITAIFHDFLPECRKLWRSHDIPWSDNRIGAWYEELRETRKRDQRILDIMRTA